MLFIPLHVLSIEEADETQTAAAEDFLAYVLSDEAKEVFDSYYFDTNVE